MNHINSRRMSGSQLWTNYVIILDKATTFTVNSIFFVWFWIKCTKNAFMLIERFRSEQIACIKSRWTRFCVKMFEKNIHINLWPFLGCKRKRKTRPNLMQHTQELRMDIVRCGNEPENCSNEYGIMHGESILKNGHP